jgi:hypothetical protein
VWPFYRTSTPLPIPSQHLTTETVSSSLQTSFEFT